MTLAKTWDQIDDKAPEPEKPATQPPLANVGATSPAEAVERCRKYLEKMSDAVSGERGHDTTLQAACECYRFNLTDTEATAMMRWFNDAKCRPAWTEQELRHKLKSAASKVPGSERGSRLRERRDEGIGSAWQHHDGKAFNTDAMIANADAKASAEQRHAMLGIAPTPLGQLIQDNPKLSEPVIDGLLRTAETMNIIAASKVGKTWLMYALLICLATGRRWLDSFQCNAGRVLLIDNELHPQTIANRMPKVAAAMGVSMEDIEASIDVIALRGKGMTLDKLASTIKRIEAGYYSAIVLDAWYRFIPKGVSENDNADVMALYNLLDQYAAESGAAIVAVHHASKGKQGDKAVTDVGAGAGAQSRAADAHVVLRPHEEDGCIVLEAAVRSFKPAEPLALRWEFPLWSRAEGVDTSALLDRKTKIEQRNAQNDAEGIHKIIDALRGGPLTTSKVRRHAGGMGRDRAERLLGRMLGAGTVTCSDVVVRGKAGTEWTLAKDPPHLVT
jgi:hypothetical protein